MLFLVFDVADEIFKNDLIFGFVEAAEDISVMYHEQGIDDDKEDKIDSYFAGGRADESI